MGKRHTYFSAWLSFRSGLRMGLLAIGLWTVSLVFAEPAATNAATQTREDVDAVSTELSAAAPLDSDSDQAESVATVEEEPSATPDEEQAAPEAAELDGPSVESHEDAASDPETAKSEQEEAKEQDMETDTVPEPEPPKTDVEEILSVPEEDVFEGGGDTTPPLTDPTARENKRWWGRPY